MISSVALNSMLHHQTNPSSSTAIADLGHNAADSSNASHSHSSGGTALPPAVSPVASYIYNVLRHSTASKSADTSEVLTAANCRLSGDFGEKSTENTFDSKEDHGLFQQKSPSNIDTNQQGDADEEEMDACDGTVSPHDVKPSAANGVENFLEAQKALHKLTSQLTVSGLNQRNPFQSLGTLSPFLVVALQQQHQTLQQQLLAAHPHAQQQQCAEADGAYLPLGSTALRLNDATTAADGATAPLSAASSARSRNSPPFSGDDEDDELMFRRIVPEDLSLKERRSDIDETGSIAPNNWLWEEQFKQLYELSNDPERREWLNDWLSFMHLIGKPVTRIPIMAKQVLDLYELYRLVVQHGGLVEIINKKLWREITKGLNLPNSITSAAFTLRTQYQKYLYDYECDRENLSCLADLQAAIEGNKREGRRTNPSDTPGPTVSGGSVVSSGSKTTAGDVELQRRNSTGFSYAALAPHSMAAFFGKGLNAFGADRDELSNDLSKAFAAAGHPGVLPSLAHFELLQKAALNAAMVAGNLNNFPNSAKNGATLTNNASPLKCRSLTPDGRLPAKIGRYDDGLTLETENGADSMNAGRAARKMTRMKISDGGDEPNSMRISVEINGQTFEGVLFATTSSNTPEQANTVIIRSVSPDGDIVSTEAAENVSEN